ncbi:MAG TPA: phasin family protein [Noviherbaspirillum sp.]|uniref:phasin family protein n=1 Tax=Noviherbaspirillum sp. TaxID=1926288 RepID=UPI002D3C1307|nr:phasin family protein [Noviherbaspirillum sp.]HYD94412.1 phasin family protein [Noviherbaspirillum sp.]
MQNAMNPLVTMYQTQLEASRRFAEAVFAGTEKIDRVMIGATQRVFNEQLNLAQAITTARDPRAMGATWQSSLMARNPDDVVSYQKEIVRIVAEMQNEINRSMQEYIEQIRGQAASSAVRPLQAAPTQANDAMFNPMTSMFSVWESAFKEVAELAKKNMVAARGAMEDAAGRTARATSTYADAAAGAVHQATSAVDHAARATTQALHAAADSEAAAEEKRTAHTSGHGRKK